ncbi:natterin-3-like isoform X1 [Gopherus flavomarginatus]|uniref:natterin-3-like isoform X1 n=2 Tax=Gopherus flavomarginatus TaxID=286002 RepID=UPI0021CBA5C6|nr:natterin-3-like isoform X1 [Gopherus flavomarginatus]
MQVHHFGRPEPLVVRKLEFYKKDMAMDADTELLEKISLNESASEMGEEKEKVLGNNNHAAPSLISSLQEGTSALNIYTADEEKSKTPPENKGQIIFDDHENLKWVDWEGSIPSGAVSIWNEEASRREYVCAEAGCSVGFFNESKGPYCYYSNADQEHRTSNFRMLVNENNGEVLEWKKGSFGSIPPKSVPSYPRVNVFVGRNRYGLGKVDPRFRAFFLPQNGKEKCYKEYEVLSVNTP